MDYAASPFNIKQLNDVGHIEGLLSGFNNVDAYGDRVQPGAFSKTLAERAGRPVPMLLHHDPQRPIGAWKEWSETSEGLYVKGQLTLAVRDGIEAHALAKAGALTGLSIGYHVVKGKVNRETHGADLFELNLVEGSLVTIPANPKTYVSTVKSICGARDIEELLRASGLSNRQSKAAASAAWRSINQSDHDEQADAALAAILTAATARLAS